MRNFFARTLAYVGKNTYLCRRKRLTRNLTMSAGQVVFAMPDVTGLKEKVAGKIIKIRRNPFLGTEIAIEDAEGRIFFGEERFFSAE